MARNRAALWSKLLPEIYTSTLDTIKNRDFGPIINGFCVLITNFWPAHVTAERMVACWQDTDGVTSRDWKSEQGIIINLWTFAKFLWAAFFMSVKLFCVFVGVELFFFFFPFTDSLVVTSRRRARGCGAFAWSQGDRESDVWRESR